MRTDAPKSYDVLDSMPELIKFAKGQSWKFILAQKNGESSWIHILVHAVSVLLLKLWSDTWTVLGKKHRLRFST
jgi:hypothetical protein